MNRVALNFWPVEVVIPLRLAAFMPFAKIRHIMVRTEVISVNPGNTAEGARFVNVSARCAARIARRPVLSVRKSFPVLNFLFPTQNAGLRLSVTLLVLRIIVGGLLIYAGIAGLAYSGMAYNVALGNLVVGAMIAIGLFVRPVCLFPAVYYGFTAIGSIASGVDQLSLMYSALSLLLCSSGPGKVSIDEAIRRFVVKHSRFL